MIIQVVDFSSKKDGKTVLNRNPTLTCKDVCVSKKFYFFKISTSSINSEVNIQIYLVDFGIYIYINTYNINDRRKKHQMIPTVEQQVIFDFVKLAQGHGIIDAVAGSGKTTTIIESASFLPNGSDILFCAFNRSIRKEIQLRFAQKRFDHVDVKTIHALGYDILRSNSYARKYIIDESKVSKLIGKLMYRNLKPILKRLMELNQIPIDPEDKSEEREQKNFTFAFKRILDNIFQKYRSTLAHPSLEEFEELVLHFGIFNEIDTQREHFKKEVQQYFEANNILLQESNKAATKENIIDFTDMLYLPKSLDLRPSKKYDFLFLDECQDLSKAQLAIVLKYIKGNGRILAVGDPKQSIYGFTGADAKSFINIKEVLQKLQHAKVGVDLQNLSLSSCFRCPDEVIELAKVYRDDIKPFQSKKGEVIHLNHEQVLDYLKPKDLVICRVKAPIASLMFELIVQNIEVDVHEDEIKDFIYDLRKLFSNDELKQNNIFKNSYDFFDKVTDRNIYFIKKEANKIGLQSLKEEYIETETNYVKNRMDFIKNQLTIHMDVSTINDLLNKIKKMMSGGENAIKLSTIHRAKGLENERVFILGYDLLPLKRRDQKEWEMTQESNLKYVALTRTKHTLFLVKSPKDDLDQDSLFDMVEDLF